MKTGLWIDSAVLALKDIKGNQKLFLAEIVQLSKDRPCTASNAHFSQVFGIAKESCTRVLKVLEAKNYIKINLIREGRLVVSREITLSKGYYQNVNKVLTKRQEPTGKTSTTLLTKRQREITLETTKESTPPPNFKIALWGQIKQATKQAFKIHIPDTEHNRLVKIAYNIREHLKAQNRAMGTGVNDTQCMQLYTKILTNWPDWAKDKTVSYIHYNLTSLINHAQQPATPKAGKGKKLN